MQIKVDEDKIEDLETLAELNRRSPTAEVNLALASYLNATQDKIEYFRAEKSRLSPKDGKNPRVREKKEIKS